MSAVEEQLYLLRVGLGLSDAQVAHRVGQAVMLEAAAVPDELVQVIAKISAAGRVTAEDLNRIGSLGYALPPQEQP